jgi:branched-chain amino acid transport system permease protein
MGGGMRFSPPHWPAWLSNLALTLLIAALWPFNTLLVNNLNDYYYHFLIVIAVNVILTTSLNLINGITGQFSLGHAGFMAVGAYTAGVIMKHYHPGGAHPEGASAQALAAGSYIAVVYVGGLFAAAAGLLIGVPTLRLRGDYLAIATLGFGEIIDIVITNIEHLGRFEVGGSAGLHEIPLRTNFFYAFAAVVICVVCIWRLVYSTKGKAFLAIREDEIAASAMGVDSTFYKVAAFVIGAFFAGVAGAISAMWFGNLDPSGFNFMKSIEIVVMVVLGGSGSITGGILAAIILTLLPEGLRMLKDIPRFRETKIDEWRLIIYALLLIGMMLFRPAGILGRREIWWTRKKLASAG